MSTLHVAINRRDEKCKNHLLMKFIDALICSICQDYMFIPMMTTCGHNYCYGCLKSWFNSNETAELSCPQCRSSISVEPNLNATLQQTINLLIETMKGEKDATGKEATEESYASFYDSIVAAEVEYKTDKDDNNLFGRVFTNSALAVVDEDDDGIARCSNCHWELDFDFEEEDGNTCPHCNARIRNRVTGGNSRSTREDGTRRSREGFDSDEYSEGELAELESDLQRFQEDNERNTIELEDEEDSDNKNSLTSQFESRFPIPKRGRDLFHDDEAEEDSDEDSDENGDSDDDEDEDKIVYKSKKRSRHDVTDRYAEDDDEEMDSDLASFIANDDDDIDEDEEGDVLDSSNERDNIVFQGDRDEDDEGKDSDFFEHNDDGFVSGDSLDDNDKNEPTRRKRYQVVLDSDDED